MNIISERKFIRNFNEYKGVKPLLQISDELGIPIEKILKLDANENPYEPIAEVKKALSSIFDISVYPDPLSRDLAIKIARNEDVEEENVFIGAGSDELLDLLIRAFVEPSEKVLSFEPTFGMYNYLSKVNNIDYEYISMKLMTTLTTAKFVLNETLFLSKAKKAKIVFICRPNNPDGQIISKKVIKSLLSLQILVIIDEAYIEYSLVESIASWIKEYSNLVILKTFSKAYGLGGLRIGYGIMPAYIKKILLKIKQPYNVNQAAYTSALVCYNNNNVIENTKNVRDTRKDFMLKLQSIQSKINNSNYFLLFESQANFILFHFKSKEKAKEIHKKLKNLGIITRYYSKPILENCIRISIGTKEQMDTVAEKLEFILMES